MLRSHAAGKQLFDKVRPIPEWLHIRHAVINLCLQTREKTKPNVQEVTEAALSRWHAFLPLFAVASLNATVNKG